MQLQAATIETQSVLVSVGSKPAISLQSLRCVPAGAASVRGETSAFNSWKIMIMVVLSLRQLMSIRHRRSEIEMSQGVTGL